MHDLDDLIQIWPRPTAPRPILMVGAGGIVRDAHLPAYSKAGLSVAGLTDIDPEKATTLARDFAVTRAFARLDDAVAELGNNVVYDLATPPGVIAEILRTLPDAATVLIQKPMGRDLAEARDIRTICREKTLKSAVNFQLRFSPMMLAAADLVRRGRLGDLLEIEVQVSILTPWHLFPFLKALDRMEIALHSIHYFDLIRAFAGEPAGVFARTMRDPRAPDYAQTRTSAILDYGADLRVLVNTNHNHRGGNRFQVARFRLEGTEGSMFIKLGVLYDYPLGEPDELWFCANGSEWEAVDLQGTWFPDAFIGRMSNLQRFASGEDDTLVADTEDAFRTMALVEALYQANEMPGQPLASD